MSRLVTTWLLMVGMVLSISPLLAGTPDSNKQADAHQKHTLPVVKDLAALGEESQRAGVPILIMFSTESCGYCKKLEEEVLRPMRLSGADPEQVLVRKVMLDEYETLRLFSGERQEADRYASSEHGVSVVPTVALLDSNGKQLVPKIVGYNTPGFYEGYLDEAIKTSRQLLQQR